MQDHRHGSGNEQPAEMLVQCERDVIDRLLPRFKGVVESTADMGWGFYESLRDNLDNYFPDA